jgi:hypothetical protein
MRRMVEKSAANRRQKAERLIVVTMPAILLRA